MKIFPFRYFINRFRVYRKIAIKLSGLDWVTIAPCHRWMEPYFQVIIQQPKLSLQEKNEQVESKQGMNSVCSKINTDDSHIIQMHTTSMDMFVSIISFWWTKTELWCYFLAIFTRTFHLFIIIRSVNRQSNHIIFLSFSNLKDQASIYREQCLQEASPAPVRTKVDHVCPPEGLLTPPDSSRKFAETDSTYK